jgi:hypothetical protein
VSLIEAKPLPRTSSDDQPGGVGGTGRGVEVAADVGVGIGAVILRCERYCSGLFWERAQDDPLGRVGDGPRPDEFPLVPVPQTGEGNQEHAERGEGA